MWQKSIKWQTRTLLALASALLFQTSCATPSGVVGDYHDALYDSGRVDARGKVLKPTTRTSIVFLVDGLGASTLREGLRAGRLPETSRFFGEPAGNLRGLRFPRARASFPTLTFPNLVSLLTGLSVEGHGIIGNRMIDAENEIVNFENVLQWKKLSKMLTAPTAFAVVDGRGLTSVGYTYPFFNAGTASLKPTFEAAAGYASKDYRAVDEYTLQSLTELLETTAYEKWPRFLFVHLISVDGVEHERGPAAPEVQDALSRLDRGLARAFHACEKAEAAGHQVDSVLTADHGFAAIAMKVPIEEVVAKVPAAAGARLVTDNRIAGVFAPEGWSAALRRDAAFEFARVPGIAWTALRTAARNGSLKIDVFHADGRSNQIELRKARCPSGGWEARLGTRRKSGFHCLEEFDAAADGDHQTYFVSSLGEYFSASRAPDMILVPEANADFSGEYKGNHGGLTEDEILVPALARGVNMGDAIFPSHLLLRKLKLIPNVD